MPMNQWTHNLLQSAGTMFKSGLDKFTSVEPHPPGAGSDFLDRLLQVDELERLWAAAQPSASGSVFERMLRLLDLRFACSDRDLARIPAHGPVVLVANHPFGLADGLILGAMLAKVRPDVRFMTNALLARAAGVQDYVIPVDLSGGPEAVRKNGAALRQCVGFLKDGGLLAVFPAGQVSALKLPPQFAEPAWNGIVARLVRMTGATALPVFFHGTNSAAFHAAGLLHASLRTVLLPRELLNKRGRTLQVAVGSPIPAAKLSRPGRDAAEYLRWRTRLLEGRKQPQLKDESVPMEPVIAPRDAGISKAEIDALPEGQWLLAHNEYVVCYARAQQIPETL